jgi:hypothetical protein
MDFINGLEEAKRVVYKYLVNIEKYDHVTASYLEEIVKIINTKQEDEYEKITEALNND